MLLAPLSQVLALAVGVASQPTIVDRLTLWASAEPLAMTVRVDLGAIRSDDATPSTWHAATVSLGDGALRQELAVRIRARGVSRREFCDVPPLGVKIDDAAPGTVEEFKLVLPCRNNAEYERYVVQEMALYQVVALFTPAAHRARLVRAVVIDSASGKTLFTRWGFILEDVEDVVDRLEGTRVTRTGLVASDVDPYQTALVGLLSYLIGNTDWSVQALHNVELVDVSGTVLPVIHDFDQAGAVAPPYAKPMAAFGLRSVRDRLYRGLCVPADALTRAVADLRAKRSAIDTLYKGLERYVGSGVAGQTIDYFDEFFDILDDPRAFARLTAQCVDAM
jgi:hypothetical protein